MRAKAGGERTLAGRARRRAGRALLLAAGLAACGPALAGGIPGPAEPRAAAVPAWAIARLAPAPASGAPALAARPPVLGRVLRLLAAPGPGRAAGLALGASGSLRLRAQGMAPPGREGVGGGLSLDLHF
jgi:hypothetical protein